MIKKKLRTFYLPLKPDTCPSSVTTVKSHENKCQNYFCVTTINMVKCHQNVNFDTEPSTGKNDWFWLLWGIFKECIKPNTILAVLRKENSHSVDIFRLVKKITNVKKDLTRKSDSKFDFPQAVFSVSEVLTSRNVIWCMS